MAKGSQLTQLKSAVSQAGIVRQPQSKKRKRTAPNDADKDKEKRANKLKEIHEKLNPFDVKITKLKHDVGGRKLKGVTGKPQKSKQAGIEQRKKTLLKEYTEKGHVGGIIDRRFGENDPTMNPDERMLERFTKERQRAARGVNFNLDDEEELTHYGQSLSNLDDFDNTGFGLDDADDDDDGKIDQDTVKNVHFGGFEDEEDEDDNEDPGRRKSKAEVMAEVIAKSKMHKHQRQLERQQDDDTRHQLDQEFNDIRSMLLSDKDPKVTFGEMNVIEETQYDQSVRELALDRRAQPKDRTKTEEELALEAKETLEKAEQKRLKRMRGEPDDSSDEEESGVRKKKSRRIMGGDDLEDDFQNDEDEWDGLGAGLGAAVEGEGGEDEEADEAETESSSGEDDGADVEGVELSEEEDDDDGMGSTPLAAKASSTDRKSPPSQPRPKGKSRELPYTFQCPSNHDEFVDTVEGIAEEDIPVVVKRIRALYHPSLAVENKTKLQTLTTVLIDYIMHVTSPPTPRFGLVSSLLPQIHSLSLLYPNQAASYFITKLKLMQKNLTRGLSRGATLPDSRTWPGTPELALLWTLSHIFPTSDMNHLVVTPARLLIGSYLGLCRLRSLQDIASGLFLCTAVLEYENFSKRRSYNSKDAVPGNFPCLDFKNDEQDALRLACVDSGDFAPPNLVEILTPNMDESKSENHKINMLALSIDLLARFADYYKSLDGFVELYQPALDILENIVNDKFYLGRFAAKATAEADSLRRLLKFARQSRKPLLLQAHKPIAIASYIPKIESSSSSYFRRNDPDHERAEASKLRYQYKQERKGAIRELRKDARFLSAVQQQEQAEKDRGYKDRMNKVFNSLEGERAEQKQMDREKVKEKKRSGRK